MKQQRERKDDVVSTRLPPRIRAGFEQAAQLEGRSVSSLIENILMGWIGARHPGLIPTPEAWEAAQAERRARADAAAQLVRVPLYDARAAAGGLLGQAAPEKHLGLTRSFLRELGARPQFLVAVRVAGDAMAPGFADGDVALVDTAERRPRPLDRHAYLLRLGAELLIRHLRRQEGRLVAIDTDPRYPPLDLPSGDALGGPELEVLGRVTGRWQEA
jgi:phage repressor protein C with HTH and peptisase S24 domain